MWRVENFAVSVDSGSIVQTSPRRAMARMGTAGLNMPVLCPWLTLGLTPTYSNVNDAAALVSANLAVTALRNNRLARQEDRWRRDQPCPGRS
jgi:hypothetical protein